MKKLFVLKRTKLFVLQDNLNIEKSNPSQVAAPHSELFVVCIAMMSFLIMTTFVRQTRNEILIARPRQPMGQVNDRP